MELKTSRLRHALQPTIWVSPNGYIKINLHQVEIRLCKFVNKFINYYFKSIDNKNSLFCSKIY